MRRFIAYILASTTILLGAGVAFKPIATKVNADLNYRNSKAITFKLTDENGKSLEPEKDKDAAKDYAAIMDTRLQNYGADDYKIVTKGCDTIVVTLTANNDTEYSNISKMLTISSKIELNTIKDSYAVVDETEWTWHSNSAYITFDNTTSIVVMPIPEKAKDKIKELVKKAKEIEDGKTSNDEKEVKPSIVLWINRLEGEAYDKKDTYDNIKNKILHEFKTADFYYGTNEDAFQIKFTPTSSDKTAIENSYHEARCYLTMLNSTITDYKCDAIHTELVPANVESILIFGNRVSLAASASFIALMVAFVLISLILAMIYRLGSIAVISSMTAHTFLTTMIFILLRPLFNISAYVGIIIVSLASLFIGIAYNAYLHEECYKGRGLKKANYEASKKTTMLAVDVSILFLVVGSMMYFIGGSSVASLGIMLIIGSLLNILINTFVLKGLMWLLTNASYFQKRLHALNIKQEKVPNLAKEEKPTYFGPYQNKKASPKQKKITGAIFGGVLLASLVTMVVFGTINKTMFNAGTYYSNINEIHFSVEYTDTSSSDPISDMSAFKSNVLDNIKRNDTKIKYDSDIYTYNYTVKKSWINSAEQAEKKVYSYVITINESDVDKNIYSYNDGGKRPLIEAFDAAISEKYSRELKGVHPELKVATRYNFTSNETMIFVASITSIAIMGVYYWIRYRASRALTITIVTLASSMLTMGYFTLFRFSATPIMAIATAVTTIVVSMMGLYIANKDKDLIRDERVRDVTTRKNVLEKALMFALVPMSVFTAISAIVGITYFGISPRVFSSMYMSVAFVSLCAFIAYYALFTSFANFFDERFMRIRLPKITRKKKKVIATKSNEPTEAIFFGIND